MKSSPFVTIIDLTITKKLQEDLKNQGFSISHPPNTVFSAIKPGVSCTLYSSGKLLVQGKAKHDFITYYLEPHILQNLTYSHPEQYVNVNPHIGIDEAGKGDFFGPLCIAGVYAESKGVSRLLQLGVCDSKRLSDQTILTLVPILKKEFPHSIVKLPPETYNRLYEKCKNLNTLLAWAHATAIEDLYKKTNCSDVIIDQFAHSSVVERAVKNKSLSISLTQRYKGEEDPVVAAASLIARHAFLEGIHKLSTMYQFPFPKGASKEVIKKGKEFILMHGPELLQKVAKMHFKTAKEVLF